MTDAALEDLLEVGWRTAPTGAGEPIGMEVIDRLRSASLGCDLSAVRPLVGTAVRRIRASGIVLSDRRIVRSQALIAAAATLDGRTEATAADLWVLPLVAPSVDGQHAARTVLTDLLDTAHSAVLPNAAEEYSAGVLARAMRLVDTSRRLLAELDMTNPDDRLRIEATLREIDAGFVPADLPADLAEVRVALVAAIGG